MSSMALAALGCRRQAKLKENVSYPADGHNNDQSGGGNISLLNTCFLCIEITREILVNVRGKCTQSGHLLNRFLCAGWGKELPVGRSGFFFLLPNFMFFTLFF